MKELKEGTMKQMPQDELVGLKDIQYKTLIMDVFAAPTSKPSPQDITGSEFKPGQFNYVPNFAGARLLMASKAALSIWKYLNGDYSMTTYTDVFNESSFRLVNEIAPDIMEESTDVLNDVTVDAFVMRIEQWVANLIADAPLDIVEKVIAIQYTLETDLSKIEAKWEYALKMMEAAKAKLQ